MCSLGEEPTEATAGADKAALQSLGKAFSKVFPLKGASWGGVGWAGLLEKWSPQLQAINEP